MRLQKPLSTGSAVLSPLAERALPLWSASLNLPICGDQGESLSSQLKPWENMGWVLEFFPILSYS